MKFIASSATMLNHLQAISRVINSKSTLPILDCFKLELKGNKLTLTAADSETRLETWIEVNNAEGEGSLAINAKNLLDPLRELPDQPLTFDINDETLEVFIYYHNGKYNFVGLKGDEYPEPKPLKEETSMSLTIEADMLMSGINRTVFATADDELRPVMNGIYFDITSDNLTFVASDGHKLVRVTTTEALVELGQNNSEATRLVNVIRERGFGDDSHNYTSVTIDEVRLERRLELAWENTNRQDMIRAGKFLEPGYLRPTASSPHLLLFPIPESAWETNNNLVQNPGYPAF
jgi:hypothetical protein